MGPSTSQIKNLNTGQSDIIMKKDNIEILEKISDQQDKDSRNML